MDVLTLCVLCVCVRVDSTKKRKRKKREQIHSPSRALSTVTNVRMSIAQLNRHIHSTTHLHGFCVHCATVNGD